MECKDIDNCRTLQTIVYGCLSTVFLCTWSALHLNVPTHSMKRDPLRPIWLMLGALVGPEVIFGFALEEWGTASQVLKQILEHSPQCGWTETHAQMAVMGGFRLRLADGETVMMRGNAIWERIKNGTIDVPDITEEEIMDRSKGDIIAKGITVGQTAWFVIQCIHRGSQHLPVTELEITTLAHTLLTFLVYFCWWNKPVGIRFPIDIPAKESSPKKLPLVIDDEEVEPKQDARLASEDNTKEGDIVTRFLSSNEMSSEALQDVLSFVKQQNDDGHLPRVSEMGTMDSQDPSDRPTDRDVPAPSFREDKITQGATVDVEAVKASTPILPFRVRLAFKVNVEVGELSVWGRFTVSLLIFVIGGSFGAVHCLSWKSDFPSRVEQIIWQVSSLLVTVIGGSAMALAVNSPENDSFYEPENASIWIIFLLCVIYVSARLCLLVLAFLQLRALPYAAYLTPSWTLFYPHIT